MKKLLLTVAAVATCAQLMGQNIGIGTTIPTDQLHTTGSVRFEGYRGSGTRIMQMDSSGRLFVNPAGQVFSTIVNTTIPDNGCSAGNGVTSAITVSGMPTSVSSSRIAVRININHTYDGDLRIVLVAPGGTAIMSLAYAAGGSGDNFTNTIFTDAATSLLSGGTAPFTGKFKPQGNTILQCSITPNTPTFAAFGGGTINPNGVWTIKAFDASASDIGTFLNWGISFSGPESFTAADQTNFLPKFNNGNLDASNIYQDPGSGNIGIGNPNPALALDVAGSINASGGLSVGSNSYLSATSVYGNLYSNGTVQFQGGTPAVGKILTSTTNAGNAAWANPAPYNTGVRVFAGGISVPNNTQTTIPFDNTNVANGAFDDGSNMNNTTHAYVAPSAGTYQFNVTVPVYSNTGTAVNTGFITLGAVGSGTLTSNIPVDNITLASGSQLPGELNLNFLTKMAANETIYIRVMSTIGGTVSTGTSQLSGIRLY